MPVYALLAAASDPWSKVLDAITGTITVGGVMGAIAGAVTLGITFVFAWWGARKVARVLMAAFRSGKLKF